MHSPDSRTLRSINFFATYQCNSRCMNCNIWKTGGPVDHPPELDASQLERLFADPLFQSCHDIGLAGGEPTISSFFWRILPLLPREKNITITTNALASEKLKRFLDTVDNPNRFAVQLSLDGIGDTNDHVRGIHGAFTKTMGLLGFLKARGIRRIISFTINKLNFNDIEACHELAERNGAAFFARMAYCGGAYDNLSDRDVYHLSDAEIQTVEQQLRTIISRELDKPTHSPAQLVFLNQITRYHRGRRPRIQCLAMHSGAVIDLYGTVYANCPAMMTGIGTLHDSDLSDIWSSADAEKMRQRISRLQCGGCWNDCQMITNIAADPDFLALEYNALKMDWVIRQQQRRIDFTHSQQALLLTGWHELEGHDQFRYRWTEPCFSFFIPEGTRTIELHAMIPDPVLASGAIGYMLEVGEHQCHGRFTPDDGWSTQSIHLEQPVDKMSACVLNLHGSYCPSAEGDSGDGRRLGMAVQRIEFHTHP